jgi:hypothetical protein
LDGNKWLDIELDVGQPYPAPVSFIYKYIYRRVIIIKRRRKEWIDNIQQGSTGGEGNQAGQINNEVPYGCRPYVCSYLYIRVAEKLRNLPKGKKISMARRAKKRDTNGYLVARAIHYQAGPPICRGLVYL